MKINVTPPIDVAVNKLREQQVRLSEITENIAQGNVEPEELVELKQMVTYTKALASVIKVEAETQQRLIDIIV